MDRSDVLAAFGVTEAEMAEVDFGWAAAREVADQQVAEFTAWAMSQAAQLEAALSARYSA